MVASKLPDTAPPRRPRDTDTDIMRGLAILGVVCIHACGLLLPADMYYGAAYYFRWAVPFFVGVFAYYAAGPIAPGTYVHTVWDRYRRLALPYAVYSLLYWFVLGDFRADDQPATAWRYLVGDGWAGQYFFLLIFQLIPLVPWLARCRLHGGVVIAVIVVSMAVTHMVPHAFARWPLLADLGDRPFLYWLPYVMLGVYLRQNATAWRNALTRIPTPWALVLLLGAPAFISTTRDPQSMTGPYLTMSVIAVSCLLLASYPAALKSTRIPWLATLGRNSLAVFCLNPLFVPILRKLAGVPGFIAAAPPMLAAGMAIATVTFVCATCSTLGVLMRRAGLRALCP